MKNIILIDISSFTLESILSLPDIFVAVLVVETRAQKEKVLKKYPDRIGEVYYRTIHTYDEFLELHKNQYSITYDDIENYRNAQLKVEHYLHRELLDYNKIQYRYLVALQYWISIFEKYKIDFVISMHLEHGGLFDSIPFEIAKNKNISIYVQDNILGNLESNCYSFRCLNHNKRINLREVTDKYCLPDINNYLYKPKILNFNKTKKQSDNSFINLFLSYIKEEFSFPDKLIDKRFFSKLIRKKIVKKNQDFPLWYNMTPKEKLLIRLYLKNLREVYQKISTNIKDIDCSEKYVYYALHLEPESSIMNRATLSNQLYIIKMLSESLPDGWRLYVKEHPCQFQWTLRNISCFRSKRFYNAILGNKNVKLINLDVSGKSLLENAQAVVTICGTTALEAAVNKVPLILFGADLTVFGKLKDVFSIKSRQDIDEAMEKIMRGFKPEYNDLQVILNEYLYEGKKQELYIQPEKKEFLVDIFKYIVNSST